MGFIYISRDLLRNETEGAIFKVWVSILILWPIVAVVVFQLIHESILHAAGRK